MNSHPNRVRPKIFVASSAEQVASANAVQAILSHQFQVITWSAGTFTVGRRPLDDLEDRAASADFGIFIFGPDDELLSRDEKYASTRDNVILELGLFIGKIGSGRCFVIAPRGIDNLKIPTDLLGHSPAYYRRDDALENLPAALNVACTEITDAISKLLPPREHAVEVADGAAITASDGQDELLFRIKDLLDRIAMGQAGVAINLSNESELCRWAATVLKNARKLISSQGDLPDDATFVWLRPFGEGTRRRLRVFSHVGLQNPDEYHQFAIGDGLAGTVWQDGEARLHSAKQPFAGWVIREGCDNETYACVCVGNPGGAGGVIGVGSNAGFEPSWRQIEVLQTIAALLNITAVDVPQSV